MPTRVKPSKYAQLPAVTLHCLLSQKNVLGGKLECCCTKPMTGFYRDGYCRVGPEDHGVHSVCSEMTTEFLEFSASRGNDLRSVVSAGERWCLCVSRYALVSLSCLETYLQAVNLGLSRLHGRFGCFMLRHVQSTSCMHQGKHALRQLQHNPSSSARPCVA